MKELEAEKGGGLLNTGIEGGMRRENVSDRVRTFGEKRAPEQPIRRSHIYFEQSTYIPTPSIVTFLASVASYRPVKISCHPKKTAG